MILKSLTYMDWLKHLPRDDLKMSDCSCPACETKGLSYQYFGFREGSVGWKLVWCNACKSGIQISRTKIPTTAQPLIGESAHTAFLNQYNDLCLTW